MAAAPTVDTQTRSAAELQVEAERKQRELDHKKNILRAAYAGTRREDGQREILPHQADQIRELERVCAQLTKEANALKFDFLEARNLEDLEKSENQVANPGRLFNPHTESDGDPEAAKSDFRRHAASLGDALIEAQSYKTYRHQTQGQLAFVEVPLGLVKSSTKATLTSSGFTSIERVPGAIELGQEMNVVQDLFGQGTTGATTIRYLQETTLTNSADAVSEGTTKPEQSWDLDEIDAAVRKVAAYTKVTDELFMDYQSIRSYINDRMPFLIRQKLELEVINGSGVAPHLQGVLGTTGVLTQAAGALSNIDALYLGINKVRTQGFFEPDAVVLDPSNWVPIRLAKDTTGRYIYGDPSTPGPETLFGKRVVATVNMVDDTGLVGNFRFGGSVWYREGVRIEATNSNGTDFIDNLVTIRGEVRAVLLIWRPAAFCKVTGLVDETSL